MIFDTSANTFKKQISTSIDRFCGSSDISIHRQQNEFIVSPRPCKKENTPIFSLGFQPRNVDVILGRGVSSYNHIGNEMLRNMIASRINEYDKAIGRDGKSNILSLVMAEVQKQGGAFIKKDRRSGLWVIAELHLIRNKISQTFRQSLCSNESNARRKQHKHMRIQHTKTKMMPKEQQKRDDYKVDLTATVATMFEPIKISSMETESINVFSDSLRLLDLNSFLEDSFFCDKGFDNGVHQYENLFD